MLTFGSKIILLLIIVGGSVAIIGNYTGRLIGRRRLSLFGLRPRHTAAAITMVSGILIALLTTGIILVISQDARTALFGLESLQQELALKEKELAAKIADSQKADLQLQKAKKSIIELNKTKNKLKNEAEVREISDIAFKVDTVLLNSLIQAGPEKELLAAGLRQIMRAADTYVRTFGDVGEKEMIVITPQEFEQSLDFLANETGDYIVSVIVNRNTVSGKPVPARFEIKENRLIYPLGDPIAEIKIAIALSHPEIQEKIRDLLGQTNQKAKSAGVLPNPDGSMGSLPYAEIISLANKIKKNKSDVVLKTVAQQNINTLGPLSVEFKLFYK
ncbi:MAG: DUF3084 domain-containing protein [bacterium]